MSYVYKTKGTCSRSITVDLDGKTIKSVSFEGGCNGNTTGISHEVRRASDVVPRPARACARRGVCSGAVSTVSQKKPCGSYQRKVRHNDL